MPLEELTREFVEAIARQHPALERLSLARNALSQLRFLELLPPLRRLDLSANRLQSLPAEIAQWGAALRFLDLSDNVLESLQQLRFCRDLVTLRIGGNRVSLFSELKYLQPLEHLEDLTLEGNPISSHALYRREIVAMLPQLKQLDGRVISPAERLVASLQQKPRLTVAEIPAPRLQPEAERASGDQPTPELDLSGTSHRSLLPPLEILSLPASPSPSPSSVSPASSIAPPTRRPLLTPALLSEGGARRSDPGAWADASVQVELARNFQTAEKETATTDGMALIPIQATAQQNDQVVLLQSRVTALENILSLQDKMLEGSLAEMGRERSVTNDPVRAARMYTQLLSAWRSKVVALMVQLRSMELQPAPQDVHIDSAVAAAAAGAKEEMERVLEVWKQKYADALAQRDLERVRVEQTQRQCEGAEGKVVKVVRTLAAERERIRSIAEEVALFAAKESAMTSHMDALVHAMRRLVAFEARLRHMGERLQLATQLVAHREARLRNSEAAIEAERRIWSHRSASSVPDGRGAKRKSPVLLRQRTEEALRLLFHRLDPYHTGLVGTVRLLESVRADSMVRDALGEGIEADTKRKKLVEYMEREIRAKSSLGVLGGTITWGELLLVFMPALADAGGDSDKTKGDQDSLLLTVDDLGVPPPLGEDRVSKPVSQHAQSARGSIRNDKVALQSLSKPELIALVTSLRGDRDQLVHRIIEDARRLQNRVQGVEKQWESKVAELSRSNDELYRKLQIQTERTSGSEHKLQQAERSLGEVQHQLQSLRRQLSEQSTQFAQQKRELESQREASVERERQVWEHELQDMAFQQTQLQSENAKLELSVRQLEREIAKQRDRHEQIESVRVQQLEDRVRKREDEVARLRRERNSILTTLRGHERKLAELEGQKRSIDTSSKCTQTPPATCASVAVQASIAEIPETTADRQLAENPRAAGVAESPAPRVGASTRAEELQKRLEQLEELTASLLAE